MLLSLPVHEDRVGARDVDVRNCELIATSSTAGAASLRLRDSVCDAVRIEVAGDVSNLRLTSLEQRGHAGGVVRVHVGLLS